MESLAQQVASNKEVSDRIGHAHKALQDSLRENRLRGPELPQDGSIPLDRDVNED